MTRKRKIECLHLFPAPALASDQYNIRAATATSWHNQHRMSVTLQSILELRALLDSLRPTTGEMLQFDSKRPTPEVQMVAGVLSDRPSNVPVNSESISSRTGFSNT